MGDPRSAAPDRPRLRTALAVAAFAIVSAALPAAAQAHSFLIRSSPAAGARLDSAPARIVLEFNEPYLQGSEHVALRRGDGTPISLPAPSGGRARITQPLPSGLRGIFVASWQVVSDDGHLSAGELAFSVGAGGALPSVTASAAPTPWSQVVANWLFFVGLALAFGGLLSERVVWRRRGPRAPVLLGVTVGALSTLALLVLLAGARSAGGFGAGLHGAALRSVSGTRPGGLTLAVFAAFAVAALVLVSGRARTLALTPLAAAAILTAARGHAETSGHSWAPAADSVHLLAVAAWVGALVHLTLVLVRAPDRTAAGRLAVRRYSRLALPTVAIVLASGVLSAFAEFRSAHSLFHTGYGQALVVKSALVLAVLSVAAASRLRALPGATGTSSPLLRRLTVIESLLVVTVLAAAGLLVDLAPPRPTAARAAAGAPALLAHMAETLRANRAVDVTERLAVGSGAFGRPTTYRLTGNGFVSSEPYTGGAVGVRIVGHDPELTELELTARGSSVSYHLWIDDAFRLRREDVVSRGLRARRTFRYPHAIATASARVPERAIPTGPFVTAREDGSLTVAFAARPAGAGRLELTTTVIGPDGLGFAGLRLTLALAAETTSRGLAVPCGPGCYRATLPFAGTPQAGIVTIKALGARASTVHFAFPSNWPPPTAETIARAATAAFSRLSSMTIDERLGSSATQVTHTHWRLEAPDRLTYSIEGGSQAVIIGGRRWDREPGQTWVSSPQTPVRQPTSTWASAPRRAALLDSGRVEGHAVWRISFVKADVPAWFAVAVDKQTFRSLELQMIAPAHFMHHVYGGFDAPSRIHPPR